MFRGNIDGTNSSKGRRCLSRFNYLPHSNIHDADAAFNFGFALGQARECFARVFMNELQAMGPEGLFARQDDEKLHEERQYVQQYARSYFEDNGCKAIKLPD